MHAKFFVWCTIRCTLLAGIQSHANFDWGLDEKFLTILKDLAKLICHACNLHTKQSIMHQSDTTKWHESSWYPYSLSVILKTGGVFFLSVEENSEPSCEPSLNEETETCKKEIEKSIKAFERKQTSSIGARVQQIGSSLRLRTVIRSWMLPNPPSPLLFPAACWTTFCEDLDYLNV